MVFIFDLDGTLFNADHRLPLIQGEKKDWNAFFEAAKDDAPIFETITIARALAKAGNILVAVTGRPEHIRKITLDQLLKYRVPVNLLLMRKDMDYRQDYEMKEELLDKIILPTY